MNGTTSPHRSREEDEASFADDTTHVSLAHSMAYQTTDDSKCVTSDSVGNQTIDHDVTYIFSQHEKRRDSSNRHHHTSPNADDIKRRSTTTFPKMETIHQTANDTDEEDPSEDQVSPP